MDNVPWQSLTDGTKEMALKVRLAKVYQRPGQKMLDIMAELKELSDEDLKDLGSWFGAAGFPCTGYGAAS